MVRACAFPPQNLTNDAFVRMGAALASRHLSATAAFLSQRMARLAALVATEEMAPDFKVTSGTT